MARVTDGGISISALPCSWIGGVNRGIVKEAMMRILGTGKTDIGLKRANNEDAFLVRTDLGLACVADGMGGAASGEVASRIFVETTAEIFSAERPPDDDPETVNLVQRAFRITNERIFAKASKEPDHRGMGCTAELLAFHPGGFVLGHVGDSRAYLFRQGRLRQVTRDHSLVQEQVDRGILPPAGARHHQFKSIVLRAVGVEETLAVDLVRGTNLPGDLFLLCSDGLTDMLEEEEIREILSLPVEVSERVERLVEMARKAGGYDNITVVLCQVLPSSE